MRRWHLVRARPWHTKVDGSTWLFVAMNRGVEAKVKDGPQLEVSPVQVKEPASFVDDLFAPEIA